MQTEQKSPGLAPRAAVDEAAGHGRTNTSILFFDEKHNPQSPHAKPPDDLAQLIDQAARLTAHYSALAERHATIHDVLTQVRAARAARAQWLERGGDDN